MSERSGITKGIVYQTKVTQRLTQDFDPQIMQIIPDFFRPRTAGSEEI